MQRLWNSDALRALVEGREHAIDEALRPERWSRPPAPPEVVVEEAPADEQHRPRAAAPAPAVLPPARPEPRRELRRLLSSRRSLRLAVIAQEVLGPPKALQP
jgi:hypothetical protein